MTKSWIYFLTSWFSTFCALTLRAMLKQVADITTLARSHHWWRKARPKPYGIVLHGSVQPVSCGVCWGRSEGDNFPAVKKGSFFRSTYSYLDHWTRYCDVYTVGMQKCQVLHVDKIQKHDLPWVSWVSVSTFHLFCPAVWTVGCQSRRTRQDTSGFFSQKCHLVIYRFRKRQCSNTANFSEVEGTSAMYGRLLVWKSRPFSWWISEASTSLVAILVNQKGHPATEISWQKTRCLVMLPSNCGCKLKLEKGTFWKESLKLPLGMCYL